MEDTKSEIQAFSQGEALAINSVLSRLVTGNKELIRAFELVPLNSERLDLHDFSKIFPKPPKNLKKIRSILEEDGYLHVDQVIDDVLNLFSFPHRYQLLGGAVEPRQVMVLDDPRGRCSLDTMIVRGLQFINEFKELLERSDLDVSPSDFEARVDKYMCAGTSSEGYTSFIGANGDMHESQHEDGSAAKDANRCGESNCQGETQGDNVDNDGCNYFYKGNGGAPYRAIDFV